MEKDFDFNSIGKRTPFRTPDGFFERMQAETMKRVAEEKRQKKLYRLKWGVSVALAIAAMVCGIVFFPSVPTEVVYPTNTNECIRFLNRRKEETISTEEVQADLMNKLMASEYVDYDNAMEVKFQKAILTLPENQRIVFNLRYYDELKYEEISRITDTKVETLKANYYFAKEKIKEYMTNN